MKPNDKPQQTNEEYEDPKLFVVVGDETFPRTGLETAFVDYSEIEDATPSASDKDGSKMIGGVVCSCDKVRVTSCGCVGYTQPCSCVRYKPCSCDGHRSCSHRSGCRCAPVH